MIEIENKINGETLVAGIIGDPVSHTFSPQIHNTFAKYYGINLVYLPFRVNAADLEQAVNGAFALGIQGLNVTAPHKKSVLPFLAFVDPSAERLGAVNTLKQTSKGYFGFNTDIGGIKKTFENNGYLPHGKTAAVIGAGGSSAAAVFAAAEMGASEILLMNRTIISAETLEKKVKKYYDVKTLTIPITDTHILSQAQVIIQTTSVGFGVGSGDSPVTFKGVNAFENAEFVLDLIYDPRETAFLAAARKNCPSALCVNGFSTLVYQAAKSFEIFTGKKVDTDFFYNSLLKYYKSE